MIDTPITQADRDAAADLAEMAGRLAFGGNDAAAIRQGIWDSDDKDIGRFVRAVAALRSPEPAQVEPVAWLHKLHMEGGQFYSRLLASNGRDEDEPKRTAFGIPGRDYSEEYSVTSQPLYAHPPAQADQQPPEDVVEALSSFPINGSFANGSLADYADCITHALKPFITAREEQVRREGSEAIDDAVATISAVRAAARTSEWSDAADHFHRICGETLARIAAIRTKAQGEEQ